MIRWIVISVGALVLGGGGGAAVLCKTTLDCHLRTATEPDRFARGIGQTQLPRGFRQHVVAAGLHFPTSFAFLPDGRIVIGEKSGLVKVWKNGRIQRAPLLDLRTRTHETSLHGLLAIEVPPDFEQSRHVYLLYSPRLSGGGGKAPTTVRVSRFELDRGSIDATSEEVVLGKSGSRPCPERARKNDCIPCERDHCGGDIAFTGNDVMWVSTGDGSHGRPRFDGRALRAQDINSLAGKILRTNRDGKGLADNPFWNGDPQSNRSKVWSFGLRNPFRFAINPRRGTPVVGNVGWERWEEIEQAQRGANLGWPCFEGRARPPHYRASPVCVTLRTDPRDVRFPDIAYPRASVTGGAFYDGTTFPGQYRGAYFYADWLRHWIRWARLDETGKLVPGGDFASETAGPVQLESYKGSLYYLSINAGELRRITFEG